MDTLEFRRLHPEATLPARAHPGDAGLDLCAVGAVEIPAGGREAVPTGWAVAIPPGFAGLVVPRSGLALRSGVTVANAPGLIDAGYRGELKVILANLSGQAHHVGAGDRIAQLVVVPIGPAVPEEVTHLPASDGRGEGGFGSTGR